MTDHPARGEQGSVGSIALLAAFVIVLLQAVGTGADEWPDLLAILLAILGVGLRIEAALLARGRGSDPCRNDRSDR